MLLKTTSFDRSHPVVFDNTMNNIFCRNTTDTYNFFNYKRQHVSVPTEPSSGQFDSLGLHTLSVCAHHGIPICLQYHDSQV
jgi:hypothetical protein